jgi:hypothetical protein
MKRYKYGLKHNWDTTMKIGHLVPTFMQYVTPLDTFGGMQTAIGRMAPMNKPVFGEFYFDQFFVYVPFQAVWNKSMGTFDEEFRDVITNQDVSYTWPAATDTNNVGGSDVFKIEHYLGLGLAGTGLTDITYSALPRYAYNHAVNKFFLDERTESERSLSTTTLKSVRYKGENYHNTIADDIEQGSTVTIDTSNSTLDVNEVTDAIREQRYAEIKEKYGQEYEDILKLHGVNPSSLAMQDIQLIGKGSTQVGISEVMVQASSTGQDAGEYVGHGIVIGRCNVPKRLYLDYGIILGFGVLRPRFTIKNRVPKEFLVMTPEDLYHKFYAQRSHDNVLGQEISSVISVANRDAVYGYHAPYTYLRKTADVVTGRYIYDSTYDDQHLAIEQGSDGSSATTYANLNLVNYSDYNHLFQDSDEPNMYLHCKNSIGKLSQVPPHRGNF